MSKSNGASQERATFDAVFTKIADEIVNELPQFDSMSQDGIEWLKRVGAGMPLQAGRRRLTRDIPESALQCAWRCVSGRCRHEDRN